MEHEPLQSPLSATSTEWGNEVTRVHYSQTQPHPALNNILRGLGQWHCRKMDAHDKIGMPA